MRFSIVIPTHNRSAQLRRCLEAVTRLRFPRTHFEVIVVDDGSVPPVADLVAAFQDSLNLRHLRVPNGGPARARNAGLGIATGDYVVFTDDDCRPEAEWLEALDAVFHARPDVGVGGRIIDAPENDLFGRTSQLFVQYLYNYGQRTKAPPPFFCANNLAFPRLALAKMHGFDERFSLAAAEDRDVCDRWAEQYEFVFAPSAVIVHHQDLDFGGFVRQHFRYGRGAFQLAQRRKARGAGRLKVAPLNFYTGLFLFPLQHWRAPRSLWAAILFILSQAANAAGFVAELRACSGRPASGG